MTQLSTQVFTHFLKIKWLKDRPVTEKFAKTIFDQLVDESNKTIRIVNPENLTYIQRYKNDVELIKLWDGDNILEDTMYSYWLSESDKERFRGIWTQRKKEWKSTSDKVLIERLEAFIKTNI